MWMLFVVVHAIGVADRAVCAVVFGGVAVPVAVCAGILWHGAVGVVGVLFGGVPFAGY